MRGASDSDAAPTSGELMPLRRRSYTRRESCGAYVGFSGSITNSTSFCKKLASRPRGVLLGRVWNVCGVPSSDGTSKRAYGSPMWLNEYGFMSRTPSAMISRYAPRNAGAIGCGG